jgi:CheY-like chemotaxis protein
MMDFMVVDPNIAFATLLEQELVRLGHRVVMCTSGEEALALARREMPELVLLDMALEGPDAPALGRRLRELDAGVRLMLIPMIGDDPVLGDDAPSIQGTLTKPFFLPELPDAIQAALEAPLFGQGLTASADLGAPAGVAEDELDQMFAAGEAEEAWDPGSLDWLAGLDDAVDTAPVVPAGAETVSAEPVAAATGTVEAVTPDPGRVTVVGSDVETDSGSDRGAAVSRRAFRMNQGRIETLMRELVADVGADGVLLTSSQGLLTSVGNLDEAEIELISAAVLQGVQTSAEVARILGREQLRFEQSIAGGSYILYALSVHDAILAVTVSGDARLGLLRLTARAAAERIAALCVAR